MLADLRAAFALLTILPLPYAADRKPGYAFTYFPLVGLALGLLLWGLGLLPWPTADLRAFVLLVAWVVVSGGLPLDGFGDACDGLLATTTPERRLEIMKDPRTGSWAVIGLVLLLLGKWLLLRSTPSPFLIGLPMVGRWALVLAAYGFPYARASGMGGFFREGLGRSQVIGATLFTALSLLILAWLVDLRLVGLLLLPVLTVYGLGHWAARRLGGGLTGDIYGALCEVTELVGLGLIAFLP
jgi:adenosylcobinamide-GDP ribazoletransferase